MTFSKLRPTRRVGLLLIAISAAALFYNRTNSGRVTVIKFESLPLEAVSTSDWEDACFVPGYFSAGSKSVPSRLYDCWQDRKVPEGATYLMLSGPNKACKVLSIKADFLIKHGAETRCYKRHDVADVNLTITDGILTLQSVKAEAQ